jgi:hypothetical protein
MGDSGRIFAWSAVLFVGVIGILLLLGDIMH